MGPSALVAGAAATKPLPPVIYHEVLFKAAGYQPRPQAGG